MKKIRLLYITTIPSTQYSFLRGQNTYMASRGYELHAIASPGEKLDRLAERDGVSVQSVPIERSVRPLRDLVSLVRLLLRTRRIHPDIAHVSTPKAALLGALAAWLLRVPVRIYLVRGLSSEAASGRRRRLYLLLERLTARLSTDVICVAPSLLDYARENGVLREGEGVVIGNGMSNGIDTDRFDPDLVEAARPETGVPVSRWIGFVGRLVADKGVEDIAVAWRAIRQKYPDVGLIMVGGWQEHEPIAPDLRAELEADPRVILTGTVSDVRPWLGAMDIFLFPSRGAEGFPNAPMEAAAMAIPVVASRVVGCVDAVEDGVTGTIILPRDSESIVRAVSWYLDHPDVAAEHGRQGRHRVVEKFTHNAIWNGLHDYYMAALRRSA